MADANVRPPIPATVKEDLARKECKAQNSLNSVLHKHKSITCQVLKERYGLGSLSLPRPLRSSSLRLDFKTARVVLSDV